MLAIVSQLANGRSAFYGAKFRAFCGRAGLISVVICVKMPRRLALQKSRIRARKRDVGFKRHQP